YIHSSSFSLSVYFFYNAPATTDIYTLSLHDALPIYLIVKNGGFRSPLGQEDLPTDSRKIKLYMNGPEIFAFTLQSVPDCVRQRLDRKSTRLNSSHVSISYAVFCLKKKNI